MKQLLPTLILVILWICLSWFLRDLTFSTTNEESLSAVLFLQIAFIPLIIGTAVLTYQDKLFGLAILAFWVSILMRVFNIPFSIWLVVLTTGFLIYLLVRVTFLTTRTPFKLFGIVVLLLIIEPIFKISGILQFDGLQFSQYFLTYLFIGAIGWSVIGTVNEEKFKWAAYSFVILAIIHNSIRILLEFELITISNFAFVSLSTIATLIIGLLLVTLPKAKYYNLSRILTFSFFYITINQLIAIGDIMLNG